MDKTIRVWDAEIGKEIIPPLEGHSHYVNSIAFSPDGKKIVSGSVDKTIRVWDVETGKDIIQPLKGHSNWISSVAFSPDWKLLLTKDNIGTKITWDAQTGLELKRNIGLPLYNLQTILLTYKIFDLILTVYSSIV